MAICVFLAVLSGAFLANKLDERKTTFIGGLIFLVFAGLSIYGYDETVHPTSA